MNLVTYKAERRKYIFLFVVQLWSLVSEQTRTKYAESKDNAPVIDYVTVVCWMRYVR